MILAIHADYEIQTARVTSVAYFYILYCLIPDNVLIQLFYIIILRRLHIKVLNHELPFGKSVNYSFLKPIALVAWRANVQLNGVDSAAIREFIKVIYQYANTAKVPIILKVEGREKMVCALVHNLLEYQNDLELVRPLKESKAEM